MSGQSQIGNNPGRFVVIIILLSLNVVFTYLIPVAASLVTLAPLLIAQTPAPLAEPSSVQKPRVTQGSPWGLCGRKQEATQRASGFTGDTTGTYIKNIQVTLRSNTYSTINLSWANKDLSSETLPTRFQASPGAGECNRDCRSVTDSQKRGSHCTPLSPPTYKVQGYNCQLAKYPDAKFVTWFHWEREIAFHAYSVPPYPASHGCLRLLTKNLGAQWIYDNTLAGITQIKIDWQRTDSLGPNAGKASS